MTTRLWVKTLCLAGLMAILVQHASAQATDTWTGTGSDNNWSTAGNWVSGAVPSNGDNLIFDDGTYSTANNDYLTSATSITFAGSTVTYTLTGTASPLTLGSSTGTVVALANDSGLTQTVSIGTLTLAGGSQTWDASSGDLDVTSEVDLNGTTLTIIGAGTTTISGSITGAGNGGSALIVGDTTGDSGLLVLSGINTYTGTTTVTGSSTLELNTTGGVAVNGDLQVDNGSTVELLQADQINNTSSVGVDGVLDLNGNNQTINVLTDSGAGTGTIVIGASGTLTVNSGTFTGDITDGSLGAGGVLQTTGSVVLSGSNSYGGATLINSGSLVAESHAALSSASDITVASGANLVLNNTGTDTSPYITGALNGGGSIANTATETETLEIGNTNNSGTFTGVISDTGAGALTVTKIGDGTQVFSGANTYTGGTVVANGTLQLGASGALLAGSNVTVSTDESLSSATFDLNGNTQSVGTLTLFSPYSAGGTTVNIGNGGVLEVENGITVSNSEFGETGSSAVIGSLSDTGILELASTATITVAANDAQGDLIINAQIADGGSASVVNFTGDAGASLELANANTYTGGTNINSGVLIVGNSSALGTGDVNNIGTSSAGAFLATSSVYTGVALPINIGGNYTQGANGTLYLDVTGTGNVAGTDYDTVAVTGTVSLTGTLSLNFENGVTPTAGSRYVLVSSSTSTVTGTFTTTETDLGNAYKMTVTYNNTFGGTEPADSVVATFMYEFSAFGGLTANQQAIAAAIDNVNNGTTTGDFSNVITALNTATANGQLAQALNELSPQRLQLLSRVAFDNFSFTTQRLENHLASLRDGDFGLDTSGISVTDSSAGDLAPLKGRLLAWTPALGAGLVQDVPDPILGEVLPSDPKQQGTATETTSESSPGRQWSAFISGNVVLGNVDSSSDVAKSSYTTSGGTVGADYRITANLRAGVLADYQHTEADLDTEGSKARIDTYLPGIYLAYVDKTGFYGNALFTYGWNDYSESRDIDFGGLNRTAQASPSGSQIGFSVDAGYDFRRPEYGWTYGPEVGLSYVNLGIDSFTETGADAADLQVNHETAESLRSRLGGNIRYAAKFGDILFTPRFSIFWQHEFLNDSRTITSQFADMGTGSAFSIQTENPSRDSGLFDLGVDAQINNIVTVFLDYQPEWSNHDVDQSVQGGAKFAF